MSSGEVTTTAATSMEHQRNEYCCNQDEWDGCHDGEERMGLVVEVFDPPEWWEENQ